MMKEGLTAPCRWMPFPKEKGAAISRGPLPGDYFEASVSVSFEV